MSLEAALAANTAALTRLADLVATSARITEEVVHKIGTLTVNVTTADEPVKPAAEAAAETIAKASKASKPPKAAPAPTPAAAVEAPAPVAEPAAPEAPAALDYAADVRPALVEVSKVAGSPALGALLTRFNVTNGKDLTPAQYPAVVAEARAAVERVKASA